MNKRRIIEPMRLAAMSEYYVDTLPYTKQNATLVNNIAIKSVKDIVKYVETDKETGLLGYRLFHNDVVELTKPMSLRTSFSLSMQCLQYKLRMQFEETLNKAVEELYLTSHLSRVIARRQLVDQCLKNIGLPYFKQYQFIMQASGDQTNQDRKYVSLLFSEMISIYSRTVNDENQYWMYSYCHEHHVGQTDSQEKRDALLERQSNGSKAVMKIMADEYIKNKVALSKMVRICQPSYEHCNDHAKQMVSEYLSSSYGILDASIELDKVVWCALLNKQISQLSDK